MDDFHVQLKAAAVSFKTTTSDLQDGVKHTEESFKLGLEFVKQVELLFGLSGYSNQWTQYTNEYRALVQRSVIVCENGVRSFAEFLDQLGYIKESISFYSKKFRAARMVELCDETTKEAQTLSQGFKDFQRDLNGWKQRLLDRLPKIVSVVPCNIQPLMLAAQNLGALYVQTPKNVAMAAKIHIPSDVALVARAARAANAASARSVADVAVGVADVISSLDLEYFRQHWSLDFINPIVALTAQLEEQWTSIWFETRLICNQIKDAKDSATAYGLIHRLELAEGTYRGMADTLESYAQDMLACYGG